MKIRQITLTLAAACSFTTALAGDTSSFTPKQTNDIKKIVHNYLVSNPQVLVEASQALQAKMQQTAQSKAFKGIKANRKALFNDPNSPIAGNPNGKVQVVEFFDYQCGHCKAVAPVVTALLKKDKDVKWIFKELPIFGGSSAFAAKAALAANDQGKGKYETFHNKLFANPDALDKQTILNLAQKSGLNVSKLSANMNNPKYVKQIRDNFKLMRALGINGTPAFVIANKAETKFQFIPGATTAQNLQAAINSVK